MVVLEKRAARAKASNREGHGLDSPDQVRVPPWGRLCAFHVGTGAPGLQLACILVHVCAFMVGRYTTYVT